MQERVMRRKDRALGREEAEGLLYRCEYGVLATVSEDGWPYAVPLSYVYWNDRIYIHCAGAGQKLENIAYDARVCFSVVGATQPIYDKDFTTYFESAVVFGRATFVADEQEKYESLYRIAEKYLPAHMDKADHDIRRSFSRTSVLAITVECLTGKAKRPKTERVNPAE